MREDERLLDVIKRVHLESRGVYGSPRIHKELKKQGWQVNIKRVERLMRVYGIQGRVIKVTRRQPGLHRFCKRGKNLRIAQPEPTAIDKVWTADITYLKLGNQWAYLSVVMDLYSRRIIGWSLGKRRTVDLTLTALNYALRRRKIKPGLIFHTDRGIEYTAYRFREVLKEKGILASVNRPGYCQDNAHMESFFHTLKAELVRGRHFQCVNHLRKQLNSYINQFYNHKRLHSGIGYNCPAKYELMIA
jgi:transposase InsO family protein